MDDGGNNNNGNLANEREASFPRSKQQMRLKLQREFQDITLDLLKWTREEAGNPLLDVQVVEDDGIFLRQRWTVLFDLLTGWIGARATIVFLFQTMQYNRGNNNRGREDEIEGEEDEEDEEDEEEITSIFESLMGITGCTEAGLSMLRNLEYKEAATPTMNINTALLLAIKKHNEGILQLDGIYYLLKQKQRMLQHYQTIFEEAVVGINSTSNANTDHSIETGIVTLFSIEEDEDNDTATGAPTTLFQKACNGLGRNTALQMLEETLQHSSRKIDTIRALMYAATKNHEQEMVVHLDCSYFLLRRQPNVLVNLLSSSSSSSSSSLSSSGVTNDSSSCNNSINDDDDDYGRQQQSKKRKKTKG